MAPAVSCLGNASGSIHGVVFVEQLLCVRPYTRLEMDQGTELKVASVGIQTPNK